MMLKESVDASVNLWFLPWFLVSIYLSLSASFWHLCFLIIMLREVVEMS